MMKRVKAHAIDALLPLGAVLALFVVLGACFDFYYEFNALYAKFLTELGIDYEIDGNKKQSIGTYNKSLLITFNEYINGMSFNVDNHASICKEYTEESLLIEIEATSKEDKTTKYEIPIKISENCNHKD